MIKKYFHYGRFQASTMMSLNKELGRDANSSYGPYKLVPVLHSYQDTKEDSQKYVSAC